MRSGRRVAGPPVDLATTLRRLKGCSFVLSSGSFRALGVLNERHQPGDSEYGIPHPGMIILDRSGAIVGKLFVPSHEFRVDSSEALRYARAALGLKAPLG